MLNIKNVFTPLLIVCLMILSASTVLPDRIFGRNIFYLTLSLAALLHIVQHNSLRIRKEDVLLAFAFLCLGLSQLIWIKRFPADANSIFMADLNYPRTSVYLLLSAFMMLFIPALTRTIQLTRKSRLLISLIILAGFCYLSSRGLVYSYLNPGERLRIDSAATISAYLFVLQSLLVTHILRVMNSKGKPVMIAIVIGLSVWVMLLTQTRSVLILYPIMLVFYILVNRLWSLRKIVCGGVLALLTITLLVGIFFQNVQDRMHQAIYEVTEYSTNNDTSIGARISMWKSGLYALEQHPFGQSTASRFQEVKYYMDTYEYGNTEGLRNIVYHLHNDIIDSSSLQGIFGGASLLILFLSLVIFFYRKNELNAALPMLIFPVILVGLGDTLFINDRFIVMFCMQICLFTLTSGDRIESPQKIS